MSALSRLVELLRGVLGFQVGVDPFRAEEVEVWRLARLHKVGTLLAPGILEIGEDVRLCDEARYLWQLAALRETYYVKKCDEICSTLSEKGIAAFPLKGVALAQQVYPKSGQRVFRDLDLLVRPADVRSVHQHLIESGFRLLLPAGPLPRARRPKGDPLFAAETGLDAVSYEREDLFLELHTSIVPPILGHYPLDHVWTDAPSLPAEDFLIHLMFHTTRHHFLYGGRQLVDLALWSSKREIDWDVVRLRLISTGLTTVAWPAWRLAADWFPEALAPPPAKINRWVVGYTDRIRNRFALIPLDAVAWAGSPLPFLWMDERPFRKLWGALRSHRAQQRYQVGERASFGIRCGWYLTRPFELVWRHAPVLWKWILFVARRT